MTIYSTIYGKRDSSSESEKKRERERERKGGGEIEGSIETSWGGGRDVEFYLNSLFRV